MTVQAIPEPGSGFCRISISGGIAAFGSKTFGATGTNTVVMFLEKFNEPPKQIDLSADSVDAVFSGAELAEWKDKDIFDKIMDWKIFGWFRPFYVKNKEMLLYLFFGVLTTAVSFVTAGISKVLLEQAGIGKGGVSTTSTVISWICAVTFAYITNRIWVFESEAEGKKAIISEAASFYGGRIFTLLVEMFMMWLGYSLLSFNYWVTKIVANVVVLILNYVISKLVVFRKK